MTNAQVDASAGPRPLRLWPGVVAVALQWLGLVVGFFVPEVYIYGLLGAVAWGLVVTVWWLLFSRAPWSERVGALVVIVLVVIASRGIVHPSIENAAMGKMLYIFAIPVMSLALVVGVTVGQNASAWARRGAVVAATLVGCLILSIVRTGGVSGEGRSDLHWRWTPTPEERLLAQAGQEVARPPSAPAAAASAPPSQAPSSPASSPRPSASPSALPSSKGVKGDSAKSDVRASGEPAKPKTSEPPAAWPGFRGPNRDDVVPGVRIVTDWSQSPPVELWRRPIGPAWSSFAVRGHLVYTQEQRGEEEGVSCYDLTDGKLVWRHEDRARFWESNGGPGPRGTPILSDGRVYSLGATGIVNALDADSGTLLWSRNAAADTDAKRPMWGFTSSPLVAADAVIVAASGRLAAYDPASGALRWSYKTGGGSYSSPHLMTIGGMAQVLMESSIGVTSVAPADGKLLWEHKWEGSTILQPAQTEDGDVLITTGDMSGGLGVRRLAVAQGPAGWTVKERWTSVGLKPYFNDFVVHRGHAYGFDGSILSCIDLGDGTRKWKGGRYGHGQLVLLADQDLLLILSEDGELALVSATPDGYKELARVPAIEGKTWNHPVLVGDRLLVRNGQEMAAFRLARAGG